MKCPMETSQSADIDAPMWNRQFQLIMGIGMVLKDLMSKLIDIAIARYHRRIHFVISILFHDSYSYGQRLDKIIFYQILQSCDIIFAVS